MGIYYYKALTQDGREISGTLEYPEQQSVLSYLESQGFIPLDIQEQSQTNDRQGSTKLFKKNYNHFSLIDFTRGLGMLLRAGLSVDRSLASLIAATVDKSSRQLLETIERDIREGNSLSQALRQHENIFGKLYISMVLAGEVSGSLDSAMERLSSYLDAQKALKERIVSAMIYPIILLIVTLLSIIILMVVVMPRFKQLFEDMGAEIPAMTRMFISASDFLQQYGLWLGLGITVLIPTLHYLKNIREVSFAVDRLVLKLPWIGPMMYKIQLSRYAETLSMMLNCGIPIQKTLEISHSVVTNSWISNQISESTQNLKEGASFSSTIGKHFPLLTQQMVKIGEEAGDLDNTLSSIASISRQEVNRDIHRVIGIFEPLIIVTLGLIVAAVIGSIMVAVLSMNDLISV